MCRLKFIDKSCNITLQQKKICTSTDKQNLSSKRKRMLSGLSARSSQINVIEMGQSRATL